MATNIKRPSLFNRRFSRLLKPVDSLGPTGVTVRADDEGFQDLDDYFSQEFENKATLNEENQVELPALEKIEEGGEANFIISQPVRNSLRPNEYTVPLKGESSAEEEASEDNEQDERDYDNAPMMDDDYGAMEDPNGYNYDNGDDTEINFSPNITLRQPVPSTPTPAPKKKTTPAPKQPKEKAAPKPKKAPSAPKAPSADRFYLSDEFKNDESHRHSRRTRIAPLEFWRGETVKYSVDEELKIPVVVGVVRRAKTPQKPKARPSRPTQRKSTQQMSNQQVKRRKMATEEDLEESGYTPDVLVKAKVMDYDTHEEEERLLAISADQHTLEVVKGEQFAISTVFEEGTFLTAGILSFPPAITKPSRNAAKHALVFYVINGVFQVTINQTSFVIGTGGQFIVPRGNHYQLKNLHDQDSKLHFCHCKDSREE